MNRVILIAALLISTAVFAQQPAEIILKVTPPELDTISKGLGTQPFNDVVPLINKLRAQFIEQQPKPETKPVDKPIEPVKPAE